MEIIQKKKNDIKRYFYIYIFIYHGNTMDDVYIYKQYAHYIINNNITIV